MAKAVYLGGKGVGYTPFDEPTPEDIIKKIEKVKEDPNNPIGKINPANLFGEGFRSPTEITPELKNQPALQFLGFAEQPYKFYPTGSPGFKKMVEGIKSGIQWLRDMNLERVKSEQPEYYEQLMQFQKATEQDVSEPQPAQQLSQKQTTTTQTGVDQKIQEKISQMPSGSQSQTGISEGDFVKVPGTPDVYKFEGGMYKPVKDEPAFRSLAGVKEGEDTPWSLVKSIAKVPEASIGPLLTGDAKADQPLKENERTAEWMEKTYKEFLGPDYEPGEGQTWESIAREHAIRGTSKTALEEWLRSPETQQRALRETEARKPFVSDVFRGDGGKLYIQTEDGEIRHIDDPEELKDFQERGLVSDTVRELTPDERNLVRSIEDIKLKSTDEIRAKDLIDAGFNADDASRIIASVKGMLPKWASRREEIESEFKVDREKAEKEVRTAEDTLIAQIEGSESLVNKFNSFYSSAGLDKIQQDIDNFDNQIDAKIKQRDTELLDARGQVIPQWMITGDKELIIQRYQDQIDQLTIQRNNQVDDYNRKWNQVVLQVGLHEKDLRIDAEQLAMKVDVLEGRQDRINERLAEALEKGGVTFEEDKQRILNEIRAGIAPTLSSIATKAAQAKLLGDTKFFEESGVGIFRYNPETDSIEQMVDFRVEEEEKGKTLTAKQQQEKQLKQDVFELEKIGYSEQVIRDYIREGGFSPEDFGYTKEQKFFESRSDQIIKWSDYLNKYPDRLESTETEQGMIAFEAKKDFADPDTGNMWKKGDVVFEYRPS